MSSSIETHPSADPAERANLVARHWALQGNTFIAAKVAVTLDGSTATRTGDSRWITGEKARADGMQWRKVFPAIAVGAGTVVADNPRLTVRLPGQPEECPLRFVFDGRLSTAAGPALPQVYTDAFRARTIVVTTAHGGNEARRRLQEQGVQLWNFDGPQPRVSPADFRRRCTEAGITGVYLEGGSDLLSHFLGARQLDYLLVYRAPVLFADAGAKPAFSGRNTGKIAEAIRLTAVQHEVFDGDLLTRGNVVYPPLAAPGGIDPQAELFPATR